MSRKDWNVVMTKIKDELSGLAKFIDRTRQGLDSIETTVKMGTEKFPEASCQLSDVTGDLENAANKIMNTVEEHLSDQERTGALIKALEEWSANPSADPGKGAELAKELAAINAKGKESMMELFALMSFQDLTGQKLKKVIGSLDVVEKKLVEIALSFGIDEAGLNASSEPRKAGNVVINQDVVDKLLKELGA
ncbi:MAG: hypothetical protein A2054_07960 [Deltaproteobacteria bacterium GWA2_55_10]|nr:MAG: hypothetical protein A2054_07960 [Deltaproteobacteria bacterium GWA2_55_10]